MTDERLNEIERDAPRTTMHDAERGIEIIYELTAAHRTLQQQTKQLEKALTELMKQVEGSTHFIVKSAAYLDAKILLINLQGGVDNGDGITT